MFKVNYLNTKIFHKKINYNTLFSKFTKYFKSDTNRLIYTDPLDIQDILTVTPARLVPKDIIRPDYAIKKSISTPKRERSIIKNPADVENFTYACKVAAGAVKLGMESAKEGMSTDDIDQIIHEYIISKNCYPSAIGFMGFPKSLCTSVNEVVCHGIPNKRKLKSGDILNMDVTTYYKGYHGDTSGMALIGEVHPDIQKLVNQINKNYKFRLELQERLCLKQFRFANLELKSRKSEKSLSNNY
jgi:methionyl aminopeptidase